MTSNPKLPTLEEFYSWLVAFGKDQERKNNLRVGQAFYNDFVDMNVFGTLDKLYNECDYDKAVESCVALINGELDYASQDSSNQAISRDAAYRLCKLWIER